MVSDHALKIEVRAQLERQNALVAQYGGEPMSYTQVRSWVLRRMIAGFEDFTALRQEQVRAGVQALDSGRDLIICGSVDSGKTALAQAVANRGQGTVYISPRKLEFGKDLNSRRSFAWEPQHRDRAENARSICIEEIRYLEDQELYSLAEGKPLAVVSHANSPRDALERLERLGFQRDWNDPVILFCRQEDRLSDGERQAFWDREDRELAEKRSLPTIVNG